MACRLAAIPMTFSDFLEIEFDKFKQHMFCLLLFLANLPKPGSRLKPIGFISLALGKLLWRLGLCAIQSYNISKVYVKYTSICIAHVYAKRLKCAQTWITQFYLQITPCLRLLPSRRTSPFGWYSFYRPTEDRRLSRPGWLVIPK